MSKKKSEEETVESYKDDIEEIRADIEKLVGRDTRFSSATSLSRIDNWCSSGSIVVDKVLAGGRARPCSLIPFGRQVEISGQSGLGKTTLCAQIAKEVQRIGGIVLLSDIENRLDHTYWPNLGVDMGTVVSVPADNLEDLFRAQKKALEGIVANGTKRPVIMILDAIGSLTSEAILESDDPMDRGGMASDARIISHGMKYINTMISKMKVAYIMTNHMYQKIGTVYGSPWETGGGQKLKYFATVRLQLTGGAAIKENDQAVGHRVKIRALKNSMSPMLLEKEAILIGGRGFSNEYTVYEKGRELGLIEGKGWKTWVPPTGESIRFQSFGEFEEKVVTHPDYKTLEAQVIEAL